MIDLAAFVRDMEERNLFPLERNRVVVACSGGIDSLCLLYTLWACREALRLDLTVCTCDHGLRPESGTEARAVRNQAWGLGLPCVLRSLAVNRHRLSGESTEMAARRLRRQALVEVAHDAGATSVALGHHADDQAETVLLKLSRGTGVRGAGGMDWTTALPDGIQLVRPLLGHRRQDLAATLQAWGRDPIHDPSNDSLEIPRNRMRHEVVPLLAALNPGVVDHLNAFAEDARALDAWASMEAAVAVRACAAGDGLELSAWRDLPRVLRERALQGWLREQGGDPDRVTRAAWQDFFTALATPAPQSRSWTLGGLQVRVEQDHLLADTRRTGTTCDLPARSFGVDCEGLGRRLRVEPVERLDRDEAARKTFSGPLTGFVRYPPGDQGFHLRTPEPGDRYRPQGMKGTTKLSDLMINRKLPARYRPVWPVITCGPDIVWVPGFRVSEAWKVARAPCLRLTLETA